MSCKRFWGSLVVTKGQGNPNWNREETILALDLYFQSSSNSTEKANRIAELSQYLRGMAYHSAFLQRPSFRNVDSVKFKIQNLRSVLTGKGLKNVSNLDREIAEELGGSPNDVAAIAKIIRDRASRLAAEDFDLSDDFEQDFYEGESAFVFHRKLERNKKLRTSLLSSRAKTGLSCEICGFSRPHLEASLQKAFLRCII